MSEKNCCSPSRSKKENKLTKIHFDLNLKKASGEIKKNEMISITQGKFKMGTDYSNAFSSDGEGPVREVQIDDFLIDQLVKAGIPMNKIPVEEIREMKNMNQEQRRKHWEEVLTK